MSSVSDETRLGLGILATAIGLGILADLLLRATPWGLNWALWATALVAVATGLGSRRSLLAVALVFSALLLWRASPVLATLNVLAAGAALAFAVVPLRLGFTAYAAAALRLAGNAG